MKKIILKNCDRCHREYEADDEDVKDKNKEKLCPDCEFDITESENIKWSLME